MVTFHSVMTHVCTASSRGIDHIARRRIRAFGRVWGVATPYSRQVASLPVTAEGAHRHLRYHRPIAAGRAREPGIWGESASAETTSGPDLSANPVGGQRKGSL